MTRPDEVLLGDLKQAREALFLGHYTADELGQALDAAGFWGALARRGFPEARLLVEPQPDGGAPRVRVLHGEDEVGELRARHAAWRSHRVIEIEWIEMRDPHAAFTPERPRLPGQRAPGLGMGRRLVDLFVAAARRTGAEGILARPQHYHNALMYDRIGFRYADATTQGRFRALERDLGATPLASASWAIDEGRLRRMPSGERVEWSAFAGALVLPVGPAIRAEVGGWRYALAAWRARRRARYALAPPASPSS